MNKQHSRLKKTLKEEAEILALEKALNSKAGGIIVDALTKILDSYLKETKLTTEDMRNTNWALLRAYYDGQTNICEAIKEIIR